MIIQHNLTAMNANRTYQIVADKKRKATEKLSSGYRLNRAADDAAGVSISEKMRSQIRGLGKAAKNIQDGISIVQIAEGALGESHSILHRMNELATQAANDSNTTIDRDAIQAEINQLASELDRVADVTSFNKEIYPLKGGVKLPNAVTQRNLQVQNNTGANYEYGGIVYPDGAVFEIKDVLTVRSEWGGVQSEIYMNGGGGGFMGDDTAIFSMTKAPLFVYTLDDIKVDEYGYIYYNNYSSGQAERHYACQSQFLTIIENGQVVNNPTKDQVIARGAREAGTQNAVLNIQTGSLAHQAVKIPLVDASAKNMGVASLDVSSFESAGDAMTRIQKAVEKISTWRSDFGARQNRLEHSYENVTNTAENTQAAESRIRDADMAQEMVEYSTANILSQVSESMMSQANNSTSSVLALLGQ